VKDIDFQVTFALENSNKFQKTRFWKEKLVKDVVTLGPTAHATLSIYEDGSLFCFVLLALSYIVMV